MKPAATLEQAPKEGATPDTRCCHPGTCLAIATEQLRLQEARDRQLADEAKSVIDLAHSYFAAP